MIFKNGKRVGFIAAVVVFAGTVAAAVSGFLFHFQFFPACETASVPRSPAFASSPVPDNIVISPTRDMQNSISITWRTSDAVSGGVIRYAEAKERDLEKFFEVAAETVALETPELTADAIVHCHSVRLTGLLPATLYRYQVGNGETGDWSRIGYFATATAQGTPFSFVYLGDTQFDSENVGGMLMGIEARHPDVAFYMVGGDMVDEGEDRNLWDAFLAHAGPVFSRKPLIPALGNHDYCGIGCRGLAIYSRYFSLPANGPATMPVDMNYSFVYGGVYFVVLNSNHDIDEQTRWLEDELHEADAGGYDFTVVMFHHPVYNVKKHRSNRAVQKHWVPLFDAYGVDLVLNGHDHSYMRSKRLKDGRAAGEGEGGTTYVVATACEKHYEFERLPIAEVQFNRIATYQEIAVETTEEGKPAMRLRTWDGAGNVLDECVM